MRLYPAPTSKPARRGRSAIALLLVAIGLFLALGSLDGSFRQHNRTLAQAPPTCGTGTTAVCVLPPSQVANTASTFTVEIAADNVSNLGAYQFTLSYDPATISFVAASNTVFLGSTGRSATCFGPTTSSGSISMACVTTSPAGPPGPDGPSGSGVLASLDFSGLTPGSSPLTLSDVIIADIEGNRIPASTVDGSVTVIEGPTPTPCPGGVCPTPTTTPTPTATPTPSGGVTTVRVDPPSQTQPVGATFSASVLLENVTDLGGYQFTLAFDNTALEFLSVTSGTFLGSSGRSVFCLDPVVGENTVRMGCGTVGPSPPGPNGSGVLADLSFRAVSGTIPPTSTLLDLFDVELSNPVGNDIPKDVQDGTVAVEAPTPTPCPGGICPTATPLPSATPSPTPFPDLCLAGSGADVCVKPPSLGVSTGDGFSVDLVVDDVTSLGAYSFTMAFDPLVLAFDSVVDGPFLGSSGRAVSCIGPSVTSGSVTFTCVTAGATPPGPSGAGILATVSFTALAEGTSPLSLQNVMLADIEGTKIPSTTHDGAVTVFVGPVPTPTITPTPTPTGPSPTPTPVTATLVWIDPPSQAVAPGASPTIDVRINDVTNLGSYEWQISYDPAVLDFVSVVNGPFLGSTGRTVFCPSAILDVGSVRFGCVSSDAGSPGPSGSGLLSTVTFSAVAEGTSALDFVFTSLSDPLGNDLPAGSQGGEIVVDAALASASATTGGGAPTAPRLLGVLLASAGLVLFVPDVLGAVPRRRRVKRPGTAAESPASAGASQGDDED